MYAIELESWFVAVVLVAILAAIGCVVALAVIGRRKLSDARRLQGSTEEERQRLARELDQTRVALDERGQEAAALRSQLRAQLEQTDAIQIELEGSRARVVDLQTQVNARTHQLAQAESRVSEAQAALSQAESQHDQTRSRLARHEKLVSDQQATLTQFTQQVAELQTRHQAAVKLTVEQQAALRALTEQFTESRAQLTGAQQELGKQQALALALTAQLADAQSTAARQEAALADYARSMDEATLRIGALTSESRDRLEAIRELTARVHSLETAIEESDVAMVEHQSVISELSAEVVRMQSDLNRVSAAALMFAEKEREANQLGQELSVVRSRVVDNEVLLADRLATIKQLESEVDRLSGELQTAKSTLNDFTARLATSEPEVAQLRDASDQLRLVLAGRELELATLNDTNAQFEGRLRDIAKELDERKSFVDLASAPQAVQALLHEAYQEQEHSQSDQAGSLLSRLTSALRDTQYQLSALEERSQDYKRDIDRLRSEVQAMQDARQRSEVEASEGKIALENLAQRFRGQVQTIETLSRQSADDKHVIADIRRQLRDAEDRYTALKRRQGEWQREQDQAAVERERLSRLLEDSRREAYEQRLLAQNLSQQLTKITAEADSILLEGIRGMTAQDAERLRAAGITNVRDLASMTPEKLELIVRPSLLRKPDYNGWIRHAKSIARQQFGQEYVL